MAKKTHFKIYTANHDACGEASAKMIDAKYVDLMYRWTAVSRGINGLSYFVIREMNVDNNPNGPFRIAYNEMSKLETLLIAQLQEEGIFTNKWDFRTSWIIDEMTVLKKFQKVEQVCPAA